MSSSSSSTAWLATAGSVAFLTAASLTALQSDRWSRRWLSPAKLQAKRAAEYNYRWNTSVKRAILRLQYAWAKGGQSEHDASYETAQTILWDTPKQVKEFGREKAGQVRILRIGKDDSKEDAREHYVWFADKNDKGSNGVLHQVPLGLVATVLADFLENQITTATFCFVADASAQKGTSLLKDLLATTKEKDTIMTVAEPFWLACLAVIVEQGVYARETLQRALFALCRVEAARGDKTIATILITLPGQAIIPQLLELINSVFPDDRLVFLYTTCKHTVQHALATVPSRQQTATAATNLIEATSWHDPCVVTTPLAPQRLRQSANIMNPFPGALAALPLNQASVVEAWMAAVDTYLVLKEKDGSKNLFLPYCCRLDFLIDTPMDLLDKNDSYWAVRSLLQYVTGSRTREVSLTHMQAAAKVIQSAVEQSERTTTSMSLDDVKAIENAVFQHKLILIENKIIKDTVLPAEHWTLKAAVKRGCACCLPEEDDEEEEEGQKKSTLDMSSMPGAFAMGTRQRKTNGGYVDGKSSFAFDPTRFS